jgi:ATP-dependent DNA helicase RecG
VPSLEQPVASLRGVGAAQAARLARLGVESVGDLLWLMPLRYEDRTAIRPIGSVSPGEKVLVEGAIELAEVVIRRRRALLARLADGTGAITLRFFHFSQGQQAALARGNRVRCFGEVRSGPTGLEMIHPEYRLVTAAEPPSQTLTPVYPSTEGLHQQRIRALVEQAFALIEREPLVDYLGGYLGADWPSLTDAIRSIHRPPQESDPVELATGRDPAQRRLALEELVAHRLGLKAASADRIGETALALRPDPTRLRELRSSLPFALTGAQQRAVDEILADLAGPVPMQRLLQGDVGSGKTVVAAFAAAAAAFCGVQTAVMAPTELLAEQHLASLRRWLAPLGIEVAGLTGSITAQARAATLAAVDDGSIGVLVGTHALFQEAVRFAEPGLIIVDEQHRFGVDQRLKLKQKGARRGHAPHQLIMTATPIPRTLAMTAYADLACSIIDELPPGRSPVRTIAIPQQRRAELVERVAGHCQEGRQAYWVCTLIEESEAIESQAALDLARELTEALPAVRIGLVHGRMRPAEKEAAMRAFKEGRTDLLVATTVIEVGVDVPNASLMVVENAERMGLAQLHQLRGRVGRGLQASTCVLLYRPPLSTIARERLQVLRATNDGFRVAEKDLQLRGPGEVLGTRQTGIQSLKIAELIRDADLLPRVVEISDAIAADQPAIVPKLLRRWIRGATEYAKV